jgi:activator of HSP90 ATPase
MAALLERRQTKKTVVRVIRGYKRKIRKAKTQSCILIGILGLHPLPIVSAQSDKSITIHQEIDFNVSRERLYDALLDAKQFSAFSGRPAEIDREVGSAFSLFKGHIVRRNLELVPNERIVQAWRVVTWPAGAYSIARFELKPQGTGTRIVFDHIGFPEGLHDHLAEGWEENYWSLLKKFFH